MWLLPIIRPLPGASAAGPGDWVPFAVVVVLALIAAASYAVASLRLTGTTVSHGARPEHRDRAA